MNRGCNGVIFFDLDGTFGNFHKQQERGNDGSEFVTVAKDLKQILEGLIETGYECVILTGDTLQSSRGKLELAGVDDLFDEDHLFCRDTEPSVYESPSLVEKGKCCGHVLTRYGIDPREAKKRVLWVTDGPSDFIADALGIVQLNYDHGTPATCLYDLIKSLADKGDGNFTKGWECLHSELSASGAVEHYKRTERSPASAREFGGYGCRVQTELGENRSYELPRGEYLGNEQVREVRLIGPGDINWQFVIENPYGYVDRVPLSVG